MIMFPFRVGKAFLESTNHPITIPRKYNPELLSEIYMGPGEKALPVSIIPPKGRTLNGEIYFGVSSYGPYYQIKIMGAYPGWYLDNLSIGDVILVAIAKAGDKVNVNLVTPDEIRKMSDKLLSSEE